MGMSLECSDLKEVKKNLLSLKIEKNKNWKRVEYKMHLFGKIPSHSRDILIGEPI